MKLKKDPLIEKISFVSHELKAPLFSLLEKMKSLSNSIESNNTDSINELTEMISITNHMIDNINDMLSMAREIESYETNNIFNNRFLLSSLFKEISVICTPLIKEKNHTFLMDTTNIDKKVVIGDYKSIKTICLNIISNCIKYTNEFGEIKVNINFNCKYNKKGILTIVISDNGIGMDSDLLDKLFTNKYVCLNKSKGTGLGMYITKCLIERINGKIDVKSTKNIGTEFTVSLPLFYIGDFSIKSFEGKSALILDDDLFMQKIYKSLLEKMGFTVNSYNTMEKTVYSKTYDLIILDFHFGSLDGRELAKKLKKKMTKVVMISSSNVNEVFPNGITRYIDDFLEKPLDFHTLQERLSLLEI